MKNCGTRNSVRKWKIFLSKNLDNPSFSTIVSPFRERLILLMGLCDLGAVSGLGETS